MAHYARFARYTYHVNITAEGQLRTSAGDLVDVEFEANARQTGTTEANSGNLNPKNYENLGAGANHGGGATNATRAAKITAFVKLRAHVTGPGGRGYPDPFEVNLAAWDGNVADIDYISFVMFTPTDTDGTNGFSLDNVKLQMPPGFVIRGAEAMRSVEPPASSPRDVVPAWESVPINAERTAAYVELPRSQILSVRIFNQ